jgi:hypothetical protein
MAAGARMMSFWKILGMVVLLGLTACASEPVKPWQKEHLARPDMSPEADPASIRFMEHIYFSREGTSGGSGSGGGGCGCN